MPMNIPRKQTNKHDLTSALGLHILAISQTLGKRFLKVEVNQESVFALGKEWGAVSSLYSSGFAFTQYPQ